MKAIISSILILFCQQFATAAILVRASGSSPAEFSEFATAHPEIKTYAHYISEGMKSNSRQEEELFSLGERATQGDSKAWEQITHLQEQSPLSLTSLHYLMDLAQKGIDSAKSPRQKGEMKTLLCKAGSMLAQNSADCPRSSVDFKSIARQWPHAELLLIESVTFNLPDSAFAEISSENFYHWTLLSNSQKPLHFYGTYSQFLNQHFVHEDLVQGSCSQFATNFDDFTLNTEGMIFFNQECTPKANAPQGPKNISEWVEKNKLWVYPLGALLIGGAAYALKDKTLVIEKP